MELISDFNSSSSWSLKSVPKVSKFIRHFKITNLFLRFYYGLGVVCSCKEGVMSLGKFLEMCRQNPGPHALRTPIQLRKRCLKAIMDQTSQVASNICLKSSKITPKFLKSRPKWCPNQLKSSPEASKISLKNSTNFWKVTKTRKSGPHPKDVLGSFLEPFWSPKSS